MSKIFISLLVICLAGHSLCQNLSEEDSEISVGAFDGLDFSEGFFTGFKLYSGVPHEEDCIAADPQIPQDVVDIVNKIKKVRFNSKFSDIFEDIFASLADIAMRVSLVSEDCKAWGAEIVRVNAKIKSVINKEYLKKVAKHAILNIFDIFKKILAANSQFKKKTYLKAGQTYGELFNFLFFWDFSSVQDKETDDTVDYIEEDDDFTPADDVTSAEVQVFEINDIQVSKGINSLAFADGFLDGFTFYDSVAHEDSCLTGDAQITQDFKDIVNLIQKISLRTDFGVLTDKVLAKVNDISTRVIAVSSTCVAWGSEIMRVNNLLKKQTETKGFYNEVASHALTNYSTLYKKVLAGFKALKKKKWTKSGLAYGDLLKYVLFWDYELPAAEVNAKNHKTLSKFEFLDYEN